MVNRSAEENSKSKKELLDSLTADEAYDVLLKLRKKNPDLEEKIYKIAMQVLSTVDTEDIRIDTYNALNSLDTEDLYNRSGKTRYGYIDPSDASWEMFEEAIEPLIHEMKKYQMRNMHVVAKNHCIGIIKGIREFEEESDSEFLDWVSDAPGEFIERVFDKWSEGNPSEEDIVEVAKIKKGEEE